MGFFCDTIGLAELTSFLFFASLCEMMALKKKRLTLFINVNPNSTVGFHFITE